jgi:hypothetical protein
MYEGIVLILNFRLLISVITDSGIEPPSRLLTSTRPRLPNQSLARRREDVKPIRELKLLGCLPSPNCTRLGAIRMINIRRGCSG